MALIDTTEQADAENLIQGQGTPLSAWQGSSALRHTPWIDASELRRTFKRLVVVAPHPDDEILGCSALLTTLIGDEARLLMVAVTDGEASHPGSSQWPPQALRAQRALESHAALGRLGLRNERVTWVRLGLADSAVAADAERLRDCLDTLLQPGDAVLTTWREDGHCDHEAVGRACAQVVQGKGVRLIEVPVWTWHWASPEDPRLPWARARKIALGPLDLQRKRAAIACHATQLAEQGTQPAVLTPTILQRLLQPFELVFL